MIDPASEWRKQFEALAQHSREAWRSAGASGSGAVPGWHEGLELWARLTGQGAPDAGAVLERFGEQSRGYFELMRTVAERLQGSSTSSDVASAWREALAGMSGGNPMLEALASLSGEGARGIQQLTEGAESMLGPMRGQFDALLGTPAFGVAREHQQRSQQLVRDMADHRSAVNRFNALLLEAGEGAFARFESKLAERSEPGRQIESARALYDVWIDAAEESWAAMAVSARFRDAYGAMVNAQMRVRQGVQRAVERAAVELDLPTRTELDSAHRRVHELQRQMRSLQRRLDAVEAASAAPPARKPPPSARKSAASGTAPRKPAAGKAAPADARPRRTASKTGGTTSKRAPAKGKGKSPAKRTRAKAPASARPRTRS